MPPGVVVELIGNDRLTALIDMHVLHGLLARLVQLRQCFQRRPACRLSFQCEPHVAFHGLRVFAHVEP